MTRFRGQTLMETLYTYAAERLERRKAEEDRASDLVLSRRNRAKREAERLKDSATVTGDGHGEGIPPPAAGTELVASLMQHAAKNVLGKLFSSDSQEMVAYTQDHARSPAVRAETHLNYYVGAENVAGVNAPVGAGGGAWLLLGTARLLALWPALRSAPELG